MPRRIPAQRISPEKSLLKSSRKMKLYSLKSSIKVLLSPGLAHFGETRDSARKLKLATSRPECPPLLSLRAVLRVLVR
jgi:hypothetical protein